MCVDDKRKVCADCGAKDGDPAKTFSGEVSVRVFDWRLMCSDCEDALCAVWEMD